MDIPDRSALRHLSNQSYTDEVFVYKFGKGRKFSLDEEVLALRRVKNIAGAQQIEDYDSVDQILVTQFIPGYHFDETCDAFTTGNLPYSQEQVNNLMLTLANMAREGVEPEMHPKNLLYNSTTGFTPIDYRKTQRDRIQFGRIINTLALQGIVQKKRPRYVNGQNRQNHPDVKEMVYEGYRLARPDIADRVIEKFESLEKELFHSNTKDKILRHYVIE